MGDSILNDIKKLLGFDPEYTIFDQDIIIHINSVLMTLEQLGVGNNNYQIVDADDTWGNFLAGTAINLEAVKSYIYLKVRLVFDTPSTSFTIEAYNKMIAETEWRLTLQAEKTS